MVGRVGPWPWPATPCWRAQAARAVPRGRPGVRGARRLVDAQPDSATLSTMSAEAWWSSGGSRPGSTTSAPGRRRCLGAMGRFPGPLRVAGRLRGELSTSPRATAAGRGAIPSRSDHTGAGQRRGTLAVVTLVGTVTVEGEQQHRADAFPVRVVDGEAPSSPSPSPASSRW